MIRVLFLFITLIVGNATYGQTEIIIIRHSADSFEIRMPTDHQIKMHEPTEFVVKTNVRPEDSIKLNASGLYLENYQQFSKTFDYHEYLLLVSKTRNDTAHVLGKLAFRIKGPRFVVTIDGDTISRQNANSIYPDSKITINFWSDTYDVNSLKIHEHYVAFGWMHDMKHTQRIRLSNSNQLEINMKSLKKLMKRYDPSRKFHHLVIALPQVYNHFDYTVLALKQDARMYILKYENRATTTH